VNWIFWLILLLLVAAAGSSVWFAFRSPKFVARLTQFASRQAWKAIKPVILSPETPEERDARVGAYRRADGDNDFRRKSGAPPKD
jgi:hypothetical protein